MELAEDTTLPSVHDPDNGMSTPRVAIAPGTFDDLQDILGKMGFGEVNGPGAYIASSAAGTDTPAEAYDRSKTSGTPRYLEPRTAPRPTLPTRLRPLMAGSE